MVKHVGVFKWSRDVCESSSIGSLCLFVHLVMGQTNYSIPKVPNDFEKKLVIS